jgi:hypothetical protein
MSAQISGNDFQCTFSLASLCATLDFTGSGVAVAAMGLFVRLAEYLLDALAHLQVISFQFWPEFLTSRCRIPWQSVYQSVRSPAGGRAHSKAGSAARICSLDGVKRMYEFDSHGKFSIDCSA